MRQWKHAQFALTATALPAAVLLGLYIIHKRNLRKGGSSASKDFCEESLEGCTSNNMHVEGQCLIHTEKGSSGEMNNGNSSLLPDKNSIINSKDKLDVDVLSNTDSSKVETSNESKDDSFQFNEQISSESLECQNQSPKLCSTITNSSDPLDNVQLSSSDPYDSIDGKCHKLNLHHETNAINDSIEGSDLLLKDDKKSDMERCITQSETIPQVQTCLLSSYPNADSTFPALVNDNEGDFEKTLQDAHLKISLKTDDKCSNKKNDTSIIENQCSSDTEIQSTKKSVSNFDVEQSEDLCIKLSSEQCSEKSENIVQKECNNSLCDSSQNSCGLPSASDDEFQHHQHSKKVNIDSLEFAFEGNNTNNNCELEILSPFSELSCVQPPETDSGCYTTDTLSNEDKTSTECVLGNESSIEDAFLSDYDEFNYNHNVNGHNKKSSLSQSFINKHEDAMKNSNMCHCECKVSNGLVNCNGKMKDHAKHYRVWLSINIIELSRRMYCSAVTHPEG